MSQNIAEVQTLTAEVKALMIGNRQVTLSVYRQLDVVEPDEMESFGRVRDSKDGERQVWAVGRHRTTGALVKAFRELDPDYHPYRWNQPIDDFELEGLRDDWAVIGPHRGQWKSEWSHAWRDFRYTLGDRECSSEEAQQIPERPKAALIARRSPYSVSVSIPRAAPVVDTIKPGSWAFADQEAAAVMDAEAQKMLDRVHGLVARWDEWRSQPLIVLAGLR